MTERPAIIEALTQLRKLVATDDLHVAASSYTSFEINAAALAAPKMLLDLLEETPGSGAHLIGLWLAMKARKAETELVVIDLAGDFYPPAAIAWGIDARRLLVVRPSSTRDALASIEIALRSPAVGAVWASLGRIDNRAYRRLLLAAEAGQALGV